jgi:hypothetical protein
LSKGDNAQEWEVKKTYCVFPFFFSHRESQTHLEGGRKRREREKKRAKENIQTLEEG